MKFSFLALGIASIVLAGCSVYEDHTPENLDKTFDFALDATMADLVPADDADTKASVTTVVRLSWNAGDQISVINLTTGKALGGSLTANETATTTTFSGTLNGTVRNGDKLAFIYPSQGYTEEQTYSPITVDFSKQVGNSNSGVPLCVYSVVTAGGNTFNRTSATFKFLMSYLQINLTGLEASAGISSVSVDNIGSSVTLGITADGISATPVPGTITMTPPSSYKVKADGTRTFYLSFAESAAVAKRTVTAYTDHEIKACDWTGSKLNNSTSYTSTLASFMDGGIPFEDANFKAYCVRNFDTDGDGEISLAEAGEVTRMEFNTNDISSIEGIKYFSNLIYFSATGSAARHVTTDGTSFVSGDAVRLSIPEKGQTIANGQLLKTDFSGMEKLQVINIGYNMLESLNVLDCSNLSYLDFSFANVKSLDVSKNKNLQKLYCKHNQLSNLDVSNNISLVTLYCYSNQLSSLNVSENTVLIYLFCDFNQLSCIDVSNNTALESLNCSSNQLSSLDVTNNTALTYIDCNSNHLSSLDVSNNTALKTLNCYSNQLTSLDVSKNTALTNLDCSPMSTLVKLIMTASQEIAKINVNRNPNYIPSTTVIEYVGDSDMENGGEL